MKIVSTARIRKDLQQELMNHFKDHQFCFYNNIEEADHDLKNADVCITYGEDMNEETINQCVELKWIMVISAGIDRMPLKRIGEKNILLTNAKGIHKTPMAEYTFAMILQHFKALPEFNRQQHAKEWNRSVKMDELYGKTLTVIGPGAIGGEIARLAKAFGVKTKGVNQSGKAVTYIDSIYPMTMLTEAVKDSDMIVSVLPYTNKTAGMINKSVFNCMSNNTLFINIGRGKTVVQKDLLAALKNGVIRHAVLDVFEEEPLPAEHPFWEMENVTLTPHVSSITSEYQPRALDIFKQNLSIYMSTQNHYINRVDFERGY